MANAVTFDLFARDQASGAFLKVGRAAQTAGKEVDGLGKRAGGLSGRFTALSRVGPRSFGLIATGAKAAALGLGGAAVAGAAFGLKTAASMETAKIGFTTMLGSAQKAGAFLKDLQQFAAATPFEFPELQTAASSLISVGINAKDVIPIMKTLGNVTAGMGTGSEGIKRATVALQQMAAAQRITAEDLNQLRDAGIPVYDLLAAATGKTKAEVVKLAQAGKLGKKELDQMMDALKSGKGLERFNGLMEKQSQSLSGLFSTLKDNISMTLANLVTPAIPAIKAGMNTVSNLIADVAPKIEGVFSAIIPKIQGAVSKVPPLLGALVGAVKQRWQELRDGFKLGIRTTAFEKLGSDAWPIFQRIKQRWQEVRDGFTLGIQTTGFNRLGSDIWLKLQDAKRFVDAHMPHVDIAAMAEDFTKAASGWGSRIITGIKQGLETGDWSGLGETVGKGLVSAVAAAGSFVKTIAQKIGDLLSKVDWVGIGLAVGKQVPSLLVGLAAGILNFDLMGLLRGLAAHWQDVLFAIIAVAFAPARLIGKVAEILGRVPLVGTLLKWAFEHFAAFSKGLVKMVGDALGFMGKAFIEGFRRVFPGIGVNFLAHLRNLPTYIGVVTLEIIGKAKLMMKRLADAIAGGIGGVVAKIGELIARMLRPFVNAGGWLIRRGLEFVSGLVRGVLGGLGSAARAAARVISTVTLPFRAAGSWLVGHGRDLIRGLLQGAISALSGVGSWIKTIGNRIIGAVKSFFKISSPSKVMAGLGGHLVTGLIQGMLAQNPVAMVTKVFGGMTGALRSLFSKGFISATAALPRKALDALGGLVDNRIAGSGSFGGNNQDIVRSLAATLYGWSGSQWTALHALLMGESGFNNTAQNPTSSAYGMFQFLNSTWGAVGARKTSDPGQQTVAGLRYIASVYGNPVNAFSAWLNRTPHWYGAGMPPTMFSSPTLIGVGERGPEMVSVTPQRMLQPGSGGGGRTYNITVNVPVGGNPREAGRQVVEVIRAYEKGSGTVLLAR